MESNLQQVDEVILYEGNVLSNIAKDYLQLTLTSKRIILEKEKGFFKKQIELVSQIEFDQIKIYNDIPQIKQKGNTVTMQNIDQNITLRFSSTIEARKFITKLVDTITGTTIAKRSSQKIKNAFEMVDDTLGFDTRGTIKGVLEKGVKGTLINGIGKKNK